MLAGAFRHGGGPQATKPLRVPVGGLSRQLDGCSEWTLLSQSNNRLDGERLH